MLRFK